MYSTDSFFRDLSPDMDLMADKMTGIKNLIKKNILKLLDSNFENVITEVLLSLPIFLFILFLGFIITFALLNVSEPINGYKFAPVLSSSMEPAIGPGSVVFVVPSDDPKIGDVISYREKSLETGNYTGRVLVHRIVDERDGYSNGTEFITKGDSNDSPDPGLITRDDIEGQVLAVIPYLGYVSYISFTNWGLVFFILIPSLVLIYSEYKIIKYKHKLRLQKVRL